MERKIWGVFTGTHLTIMFTAAILAVVPTAVWSVTAFTNVAIQDAVSGNRAGVDAARRLFVYDQVGDWQKTPANYFRLFSPGFGSNNCHAAYTVPAGKALIIKSIHVYINRTDKSFAGEVDFFDSSTCLNSGFIAGGSNAQDESKVLTFGDGLAIPSGHTVSAKGFNTNGASYLYGYLVPAGWVPASAPTSGLAASPAVGPVTAALHR